MQQFNGNNNKKKITSIIVGIPIIVIIFGIACVTFLIWSILCIIFRLFIRGKYAGKRHKTI
jgi:hypothetical protein